NRVALGDAITPTTVGHSEIFRALNLAHEGNSLYYRLMSKTTSIIYAFYNVEINSFATERLPGVVFLSLPEKHLTSMFFLEELVHQCGHVMFSAMS
ncbi:unnamed protein product, partial [Phaeothamnion confervicola]